jgi:4-methylaminobutanoate oxidase (formaldehyde-forming)
VVVIGGGVIGCSTAYHLAKLGCADVVLLEHEQLTSGTTWHSAAQVRQLRSTENLTKLIRYSAELYASLQQETAVATGWRQTGSLSIATTRDRLTHINRQASLARAFGVEAQQISPAEAKQMWPLLRADDVIGAVYSPSDGRVNPSDLCAALARGAKARGAKFIEHVTVNGFETANGRIAAVQTDRGRIACDAVANCTGLWGRQVSQYAGVSTPLYACEHFYLLTKPIAGVDPHLPTLSDHDGHLYMRDEVGGLLIGCFEPLGKALPLEQLPANFAFDLLNEDWDHFEPMMHDAIHRIPALESAEVRTLVNGPESFTPDGSFLIGEAPELAGFFVACGMNSVGIASGGGVGRALAEWMLEGNPTMDLWPVDIRRFAQFHNNVKALRERVPEVLGLHYAITYPHREHHSARDIRRTALHDRLLAKGARFTERMGWERSAWFAPLDQAVSTDLTFGRPGWFERVAIEHRAARNDVVVFDQSTFTKLLVQGTGAERVLQRLCANDMAVAPGGIVYTPMLNANGGYESDMTVMRLTHNCYLLVTGTTQATRDMHWIQNHLADEDHVYLTDMTSAYAVISVMGPRSRELLTRVSPDDFSNQAFPYYSSRDIEIGYTVCRAARLSYVGELGWELYIPTEYAAAVYDTLFEAGGDLGLIDAGMNALTSLRIEKGYRAWGADLTPDYTPFEAGLGFAVKFDKRTNFIGRDALRKLRETPPSRRLIMLTLNDPAVLVHGGEPIVYGETIVGQITSCAYGHTVGHAVAMGYIDLGKPVTAATLKNASFTLELAGECVAVTATLKAPYDAKGERLHV